MNDERSPAERAPVLRSVRRIWSRAPHNAFTDLVRFRGAWLCTFRESERHVGSLGKIRVIRSTDGSRWRSVALFSERGVDLRDPKLSVAPDGRLMLVMGGSRYRRGSYVGRRPRVQFSGDGRSWSAPVELLDEGDWLWRVTWHDGVAYGITYKLVTPSRWSVTLVASEDGVRYRPLARLRVGGKPNEATLRFRPDGSALALVRREGGDQAAWIGASRPPYREWSWHSAGLRIGGPNLVVLPDGSAWAAGRVLREGVARTAVGSLSDAGFLPVLDLPSGGDCSYPGLVWHRRALWMSYYSSHEGKSSIYLAKLSFGTHIYSGV